MNNNQNHALQKPKFSVAISTAGYQSLINNTLGDANRAKRFIASITSAVAVNPVLQECEAGSILAGALLGESLNLSPSPQLGQYYLVPFNGKKAGCKKAQFILGYKGYLQLAIRSGYYNDIDAIPIREGEYKGRDSSTGKPVFKFIEDEDIAEATPVVGYLAYFEYLNGFRKSLYWSKEKMMNHADNFSSAFSRAAYLKIQNGQMEQGEMWKYSSFWYKDFDSMALKTMLRQLISKWGVMSTELQSAMEKDNALIEQNQSGDFVSVESEPDVPEVITTPEATGVVEQANLNDF